MLLKPDQVVESTRVCQTAFARFPPLARPPTSLVTGSQIELHPVHAVDLLLECLDALAGVRRALRVPEGLSLGELPVDRLLELVGEERIRDVLRPCW